MSTKNIICNLALAHLGVAKPIADINTDNTTQAEQCRLFFDVAFNETLEECRWAHSTRFAPLTLIGPNPTTEWAWAYDYPSDALYVRRILASSEYFRNRSYRWVNGMTDPEFIIVGDDSKKIIYSNVAEAVCEYTKGVNPSALQSSKFTLAVSFLMAYYLAPTITKTDGAKAAQTLYQKYRMKVQEAQALNFNEQKNQEEDRRSQIEISRRGY